jgi:ABC-type sugar transport system ATPase subunit
MTLRTSDQADRPVLSAPDRARDVVLSMSMISKRYAGVQALSEVSLQVRGGVVHSLVGGNGAGKSTLIKIATGAEKPDSGSVHVSAAPEYGRGITAIYQELTIVPEMTALANVFLGAPRHRYSVLSRKKMLSEYRSIGARFQTDINSSTRAGSLSVADQQLLEIMRALVNRYRVIVMDEPTASLGARERQNLYRIIAELKAQGTAIVFIGHDLDEVLLLSDQISVLRNGRLVSTQPTAGWTRDALVKAMLDDNLSERIPRTAKSDRSATVLSVRNLQVQRGRTWDFDLHQGEILGIGGLVGSGRTSLLHALAGLRPAASGALTVNGIHSRIPRTVREALKLGIVLSPEDRKRQGLVLSLSGRANLCLTNLKLVSTAMFVRRARQEVLANMQADAMVFARSRLSVPSRYLSGGNQQKLVIGKWLSVKPTVLLLDEPTRGIDVGAKAEIYRTMRALCDQGMSVIVVSSELSELSRQCDRVILIGSGRQLSTLSHQDASVELMTELIFASIGSHEKAMP